MRLSIRLLLVPSLMAAAFACTAGTVTVYFVNAGSYWDAGATPWDQAANRQLLATYLERLGQRLLPADQLLKVEVLQVGLAGRVRHDLRGITPVRILNGGADWPRIQLRYWLEAGGRETARGEEWISDPDYLRGPAGRLGIEALHYEKRMLEAWFKARFVDGAAAPG